MIWLDLLLMLQVVDTSSLFVFVVTVVLPDAIVFTFEEDF